MTPEQVNDVWEDIAGEARTAAALMGGRDQPITRNDIDTAANRLHNAGLRLEALRRQVPA